MARPPKLHSSVEALYSYLLFYIGGGTDERIDDLVCCISSQSKLAKFENLGRGIVPCSLNAQKAAAEDCFSGGFAELNSLRLRAIEVSQRRYGPSRGSKAELGHRLKEQALEVHLLKQENSRLTIAINELVGIIYRSLRTDDLQRAVVDREVGEVLMRFGF